jgi:predicted amidophosphoribosyltransferase
MAEEIKKYEKKAHICPFCDAEIAEAAFPYCEACGLKVLYCPGCGATVPRDREECPECGTSMRNIELEEG